VLSRGRLGDSTDLSPVRKRDFAAKRCIVILLDDDSVTDQTFNISFGRTCLPKSYFSILKCRSWSTQQFALHDDVSRSVGATWILQVAATAVGVGPVKVQNEPAVQDPGIRKVEMMMRIRIGSTVVVRMKNFQTRIHDAYDDMI